MKKILPISIFKNVFKSILISFFFVSFTAVSLPVSGGNKITVSVTKKSYNGSDISCSGSADAQLTITATGGTAPYQYSINNGSTYQPGNVFSNLAGGQNYVVVVKDSNGTTSDATWIYVNQAPSP